LSDAIGRETQAWKKAKKLKDKKTEFALKYAIEETNWTVPRYMAEGLAWLAEEKPSKQSTYSSPFALNPVIELDNRQLAVV
jgi:hypothetical protein